MTRFVAALLLAYFASFADGASPDPKDLAIPPQELSKAREHIKRLGSEVYREREEAHAELSKMGRLARPALVEAAAADTDPEVRYRCSRLLPKAAADDLKARLDTFMADTDGKYEHDLPGLKLFRKHVGSEEKARALFVEVVKSPYNVELLQAIEKTPADAGRAISDRRTLLWSTTQGRNMGGRVTAPQQIQLPDVACLLFAEAITPTKEIPRTGMFSYVTGVNFLQQQASMNAINGANGAAHVDPYKKIIGQWMETREDVQDLNQLYYVVGQQLRGFPQCVPLLRKIVNTEGVYGYAKGQAMMHLTQIRGKEELPNLQGLLKNDTQVQVVWFGNVNPNQQPVQHQCLSATWPWPCYHPDRSEDAGLRVQVPAGRDPGPTDWLRELRVRERCGPYLCDDEVGLLPTQVRVEQRPAQERRCGPEEGRTDPAGAARRNQEVTDHFAKAPGQLARGFILSAST